jgi:hypothetical protein
MHDIWSLEGAGYVLSRLKKYTVQYRGVRWFALWKIGKPRARVTVTNCEGDTVRVSWGTLHPVDGLLGFNVFVSMTRDEYVVRVHKSSAAVKADITSFTRRSWKEVVVWLECVLRDFQPM